jgi:hypothetical protein
MAMIDLSLMMALALLAEERSPIRLTTTTGLEIAGALLAAGEDVLTVRTDSSAISAISATSATSATSARRSAYLPLSAVAWCELR